MRVQFLRPQPSLFRDSLTVKRTAVNRADIGSNPVLGAILRGGSLAGRAIPCHGIR